MAALAALLDWLSGNVPGGLLPYFFFLLLVNLTTFYLGKHSGLMRWSNVRRKLLYFNLLFVVFYVSIRLASAPRELPPRLLVFPSQSENDSLHMQLSLLIRQNITSEGEFLLHPAAWLVRAAPDSILISDFQDNLARRLGADFWLTSRALVDGWQWQLHSVEAVQPMFSGMHLTADAFLQEFLRILALPQRRSGEAIVLPDRGAAHAHFYYWRGEKRRVLQGNYSFSEERPGDLFGILALAAALKDSAHALKREQLRIVNPYKRQDFLYRNAFIRSRETLLRLGQMNPSSVPINLSLADAFLLDEQFDKAELALARALAETDLHPDIFFLFSYLDASRFARYNLENMRWLLERSLALDPLYEAAVLRYIRKLGEESITENRFVFDATVAQCEAFLRIQPGAWRVRNELAGLLLLGGRYTAAQQTVDQTLVYAPDAEAVLFNAGIIRYRTEQFSEALPFFDRLINEYNHLDARLYRAMIYRQQGRYADAVLDFRYRVLNKLSDDDRYYKEAVKGIALIRSDLAAKGIDLDSLVAPYRVAR
jgi:tetratricopeptide (TPR) repeat protein